MRQERETATLPRKVLNAVLVPAINGYLNAPSKEPILKQRKFFAMGREGVTFMEGKNFYRRSKENEGKIPVLTYHPLGNTWIGIESATKILGIKTFASFKREAGGDSSVAPSPITKNDKILGTMFAPEMMCFPIKPIIGHLLNRQEEFENLKEQAKESGHTDDYYQLFLTHISSGPCKEREYAILEEANLSDAYAKRRDKGEAATPFDFYGAWETKEGLKQTIQFLAKIAHTDEYHVAVAMNTGIQRTKAAEALDRAVLREQSMLEETNIKVADRILNRAKAALVSNLDLNSKIICAEALAEVKKLPKRKVITVEKGKRVEKDATKPIGVIYETGEIFHCAEVASVSYNYAREVVKRGFDLYVDIGLGHYLEKYELTLHELAKQMLKKLNPVKRDWTKRMAGRARVKRSAGGHHMDIVASIQAAKEGKLKYEDEDGKHDYDGIGVLGPFLCAPNTMSANNTIHTDSESPIPISRYSFDSQDAEAGLITRIEGFLDPIVAKKQRAIIAKLGK
ncbi:MAG: hypothetical protein Q7K55_09430 [Candidatus Levybacteria bacterium]|nr:hypothetical protein [Candidatus Levybacteria bacterium]